MPPDASSPARRRIATGRSSGRRCIHTADSNTASYGPWTPCKEGSAPARHVTPVPWCSRSATRRSSVTGSTASTVKPRPASAAASRPVPAPTSRTRAGDSGSAPCTDSNRTLSYTVASRSADSA